MGQRKIAEYLLQQGATPDICAMAMLGRRDEVAAYLQGDAALAKARGAHGRIPALYHAALGGDVEIARMLVDNGAGADAAGALHAAVRRGDVAMAEFLLDNAATRYANFQTRYPGLELRLTQYHIASYLGITPVALSRIRHADG